MAVRFESMFGPLNMLVHVQGILDWLHTAVTSRFVRILGHVTLLILQPFNTPHPQGILDWLQNGSEDPGLRLLLWLVLARVTAPLRIAAEVPHFLDLVERGQVPKPNSAQ
jgi:hypothetical protein